MAKTRDIGRVHCVRCNATSPVSFGPDNLCPQCQSMDAWQSYAGRPLIISHTEADNATAWRDKPPSMLPVVGQIVLAALSLGATVAVVLVAIEMLGPEPTQGLDKIMKTMTTEAKQLFAVGLLTAVLSVAGALLLARARRLRSHALLGSHLLGLVAGLTALVLGGMQWTAVGPSGFLYTSMPALSHLEGLAVTPQVERIARSTVVVVAPNRDGDGRAAAIGTGAVIAREAHRAWLVTCSHVAIPYESTAAIRDPAKAHPVWIQFSDGRSAMGRVTWAAPPPLDVAIVAIDIDNPPPAVEISPITDPIGPGAPVFFVPNPYRDGWMVHHGSIEYRKSHNTPAGTYALLFTTLPVQSGDSGSGLFDLEGRLIGLNTWTRRGESGPRGISLPSEALRSMIKALKDGDYRALDGLRANMKETSP